MAIDPVLLAALTSGASTGAKTTTTASGSTGIDWSKANTAQPGAWSLGQGIIDLLSTGGYYTAGAANKVGQNVAGIQRGDLGGLLDLINPISGIAAGVRGVAERRTYSQNLKEMGVDDNTATWLGLALDIGLDPTTYLSGGTVAGIKGTAAGVRLATAANKANSTVLKSAAEAAANNIPNTARAYIPSEVPLTQGQKMGNYLTGVLRGYESNKTAYLADRANKKAVKGLQKQITKAQKAKNTDLVDRSQEIILDIIDNSKVAGANIADNAAALSRQKFFDAISENPILRAKLGKKGERMVRLGAKADELSFVDPKTAKKVDAETASASAKAAQSEGALAIDSTPAALKEELSTAPQPVTRSVVEAEVVATNKLSAEEAAKKELERQGLQKSYDKSIARVQTKYGEISKEASAFIARTVDAETGRPLSETLANAENPLEELAELFRLGKVKPTTSDIDQFARTLGVSADPQQSVVDLVRKTLVAVVSANKRLKDKENKIAEIGNALARGIQTGFENATSGNTAASSGMANSPAVGAKVDQVIDINEEAANHIKDIVEEAATGTKGTSARTKEELQDQVSALKVSTVAEVTEGMAFIKAKGSTTEMNLENIMQTYLEDGPVKNIRERAKAEGRTGKSILDELVERARSGRSLEEAVLRKGDIRIDLMNPESRIGIYKKLTNAIRSKEGKGGRTPEIQLEEESQIGRLIENLFRLYGVSVRTRENLLMQLKRDGQSFVGDGLSDGFVPMDIDLTYFDIASIAVKKDGSKIFSALRYPGSSYQNVMPTNFEYAFLALTRFKQLNADLSKGSEAWNEIRKTFDQAYRFKDTEGVVPKKVPVADYFKPADHLNPKTTEGGKRLKKIESLDAKTDAAIQFMIDNSDELLDISSTRASARIADEMAGIFPDAAEVLSDLVRLSVYRADFSQSAVKLADPRAADDALIKGLPDAPGLAQVEARLKKLMTSIAEGSKVFDDPNLAGEVLNTTLNVFMKSLVSTRGQFQGVDGATVDKITDQVQSVMTRIKSEFEKDRMFFNAMGKASPSVQLAEKAIQAGKRARFTQMAIKGQEIESVSPLGTANKDNVAEAIEQAGVKASDEKANFPHNQAEAMDDPYLSVKANAASSEIKDFTDAKFDEKFLIAFSGRQGMGLDIKNIIGGIEFFNQTKTGLFKNTLAKMFLNYGKDIPKINAAFKLVQKWGKEMARREDTQLELVPFTEWVKTAEVGTVDLRIAEAFSDGVAAMFGADGVLKTSIHHSIFPDELNNMFSIRKFTDGEGGLLRLPDKAGPIAIKYSWADATIVDKKSSKKANEFTSLSFLANYADALHSVQTRIGIGASFSRQFGKTAKQIKEEGLSEADFIKVDPADEFAKYLDSDKFFDAAEWEKLRYVKNYTLYPKSFSSEAMQKVIGISDMITSVLKGAHTTWRPGHHVTSIIGEALMNSFAGVNSPKYYSNAFGVLRAFDPSVYNGDPNMFKAYAEIGSPKGMQIKVTGKKPDGKDMTPFDEVGYINADTGKKTIVSYEAIAYMARRLGVLTFGGASTVEDLDLRGMGEISNSIFGGVSRFNGKLANFSSHRDNIFRMAHFIKEIERGGVFRSFEEAAIAAAKEVTTYHPTIGGLSAFERKYMRRAVFFYTWQRIAATKVFQLILEQPGKIIIPSKIQYAFAESNGFNPESFGDPWDPDGVYASWHTGSTFGPQFQGPGGKGDAWGFGPAVPQLDILNSLFGGYKVQPGQSGLDVLLEGSQNLAGQNLSPLPKWFVEITSGNRVGTGGDINNYLEYAIDQVGGLNTLSKLTGVGQDPETSLTPTEQAERKTRILANWFLGQKLQDYSTSQTIRQWNTDQRLMMQRLTGQE